MKTKPVRKPAKVRKGILIDMARTIGSTLGTLAAKTGTVTGEVKSFPARRPRTRKTRSSGAKPRAKRKA